MRDKLLTVTMAKTRAQKEQVVNDLAKNLAGMRSIVFANYEGLKVQEIEELRKNLKKEGIAYSVAKKTLLGHALKQAGIEVDPKQVNGNFATIISTSDEVAPARIVAQFSKTHEALKIMGGILESKLLDADAVKALSKLPGKQELLGKIVGTLNAPINGFVSALAGNLRNFVMVLGAVKDKKSA